MKVWVEELIKTINKVFGRYFVHEFDYLVSLRQCFKNDLTELLFKEQPSCGRFIEE